MTLPSPGHTLPKTRTLYIYRLLVSIKRRFSYAGVLRQVKVLGIAYHASWNTELEVAKSLHLGGSWPHIKPVV